MGKVKKQASTEALDVKAISEKLESLPRDKLMYVAGAVTALAAASTAQSADRPA